MGEEIEVMLVYIDGVYDERKKWQIKIQETIKGLKKKIELCEEKEQDSAYFQENWNEAKTKCENQIEILREVLDNENKEKNVHEWEGLR